MGLSFKRLLRYVLLVLVIAFLGQCFYYTIWCFTDETARNEIAKGWPFYTWETLIDYLASCLVTTFATLYFWRTRERAEKERSQLRLQVLDNQLSPHFVFNNFSILADLIEVNPQKASEYLMHLSKVYRYSLIHQEHSLVSLEEELDFILQYRQLLNERFGESVVCQISPDLERRTGLVPPCVLQMLLENAIKHNEHTINNPLIIEILGGENSICVRNKIKTVSSVDSANVGQHNIAERYRLLTGKNIVITKNETEYCVTLPLIEKKQK